jgi:hypothetical protein
MQPVKRTRRACLKKNGNWADHQLRAAMAAIDQGCPVQTAALDYEIPRNTLRYHVMEQTLSRKRGRKHVLSTVEEKKLVKYIMGMAKVWAPFKYHRIEDQGCRGYTIKGDTFQGWHTRCRMASLVSKMPP